MSTALLPFLAAGIAGFRPANLGPTGLAVAPSQPIFTRSAPSLPPEFVEARDQILRGEVVDPSAVLASLMGSIDSLHRGINTGVTAFPVRENLEAEAKILVPQETPLRNKLNRKPGAGTAAAWKQATSLGGGWGAGTDQPGGGAAVQLFFSESGAPGGSQTTYANKAAAYKLMGYMGSVTGFAAAAGDNFQNQLATEKRNALNNFMLLEEHALINADPTSTAAPWGDGAVSLSYGGLLFQTSTANGVPAANIQVGVGALTFAHLDAQLTRIWLAGGRSPYMLMNAQEARSIRNIASNAANGLYKIQAGGGNNSVVVGLNVDGYVHPITGEIVPIIVSRFMPAGTIEFGSDYLPDGSPALELDVLPQVQLPELAPNDRIEGYVVQELAPTQAAPQVYPFLISLYATLKMKGATVFAKSTGLTFVP